jgi:hypothetical protein
VRCGRQDFHYENRMGRHPLDDLDAKILAILDKSPFESTQSRVQTVYVRLATVLWRLHDLICFISFHVHWAPHVLTVGLREKRTEYAQIMLPFLYAAERDDWYHLVTDNKS